MNLWSLTVLNINCWRRNFRYWWPKTLSKTTRQARYASPARTKAIWQLIEAIWQRAEEEGLFGRFFGIALSRIEWNRAISTFWVSSTPFSAISMGSCHKWRPRQGWTWLPKKKIQRLWVIWEQYYLRVAAGPCLPNGPIMQLSPYLTQ